MSQPPQGQPPYGPDGRPLSGDQPGRGGGWGQPPSSPQPGRGWGPPQPQQPGQGWGRQPGQGWGQPAPPPGQDGRVQPGPGPGGYGPPPGQGGWGTAPAPGYGQQPTQMGGFGVPGQPPYPGGPSGSEGHWGTPPGGPPAGGGTRNVVLGLIAALVVLIVAGVALMVGLGDGNEDPATTAGGDPGSTTSSAPFPSSPSSSAGGGFSSAPTGEVDPADFVALLPADFTDCTETEPAGDGDLASAVCGASATQPGPAEARFYLYPDVATLDSVFQSDVSDEGLAEFGSTDDCTTGTGYGEWTYSDGTPGGQVACHITDDGHVLLAWTDDEYLTEGAVRAPGSTQDDVSALYEWWTENSDYQG